jgi:TRAP-type C4-dicarboxylate transport system substrate-binding protein
MYVLILTTDSDTQQSDAQLIAAEDWNKIPTTDRAIVLKLATAVCQTQNGNEPKDEKELLAIINDSIQITYPNEEIY